jgi:hypothetical protein
MTIYLFYMMVSFYLSDTIFFNAGIKDHSNFFIAPIYARRYTEGRNCCGMDHYANKTISPSETSDVQQQLQSPSPSLPAPSFLSFDVDGESRGDTNWFGVDKFSPVASFMPHEVPQHRGDIPHTPNSGS